MKNIFKLGSLIVAGLFYLSACNKVDDLKVYGNGGPVTLTSSVNTLAPQATDSNSNVIPNMHRILLCISLSSKLIPLERTFRIHSGKPCMVFSVIP